MIKATKEQIVEAIQSVFKKNLIFITNTDGSKHRIILNEDAIEEIHAALSTLPTLDEREVLMRYEHWKQSNIPVGLSAFGSSYETIDRYLKEGGSK